MVSASLRCFYRVYTVNTHMTEPNVCNNVAKAHSINQLAKMLYLLIAKKSVVCGTFQLTGLLSSGHLEKAK